MIDLNQIVSETLARRAYEQQLARITIDTRFGVRSAPGPRRCTPAHAGAPQPPDERRAGDALGERLAATSSFAPGSMSSATPSRWRSATVGQAFPPRSRARSSIRSSRRKRSGTARGSGWPWRTRSSRSTAAGSASVRRPAAARHSSWSCPSAATSAPGPKAATMALSMEAVRGARVLLVEDERSLAAVVAESLVDRRPDRGSRRRRRGGPRPPAGRTPTTWSSAI